MDETKTELMVLDFEEALAAGIGQACDWMEYNRLVCAPEGDAMWSQREREMGLQLRDGWAMLLFMMDDGSLRTEIVGEGHMNGLKTAVETYRRCMGDDWGFSDACAVALNEVDPLTDAIEELMDDDNLKDLMRKAWVPIARKVTSDDMPLLENGLYDALSDYCSTLLNGSAPECTSSLLWYSLRDELGNVITELMSYFKERLTTPWDERDETSYETDSEEE